MRFSIVAALLLAAVAVTQAVYTGTWVDTDGRTIYLCETGNNDLQGSYNEVGFIQGTISSSGQIARGFLYQAIHPAHRCVVREFTLDHVSDQFRGEWECEDDDTNGIWEATRVSSVTPSVVQCALLANSGDLSGRWNAQNTGTISQYTLDICFDDDEFNNSYEYSDPGANEGISYGELYQNRRIGVGNYEEDNNLEGWDIYALLQDGSILSYYWDISADDEDVVSLNPSVHGTERFSFGGATTQMQCRRNLFLADDDDNGIDDDDGNPNSNSPLGPAPPSPGASPNSPPPSPSGSPNSPPPSPSGSPNSPPPSPSGSPNSPPPPPSPNSPPPPPSPNSPPPPPSPNSPPPPPSPPSPPSPVSGPVVITVDPDSFFVYAPSDSPSPPPPSPS